MRSDGGLTLEVTLLAARARHTVLLVACATLAWSLRVPAEPLELREFEVENPAPGVYVHYGATAEMTPVNAGDIANLGFVIGEKCVAVIDTGGTYAVGRALRLAIRRVTTLRRKLVFLPLRVVSSVYAGRHYQDFAVPFSQLAARGALFRRAVMAGLGGSS